MRLVKVAKALGMTGQQLRHELESVDFGVKSTDREITDSLAQGVVRFIARKHGLTVDMESLGFDISEDMNQEEEQEDEVESQQEEPEAKKAQTSVTKDREPLQEESVSSAGVKVLRKLTLDDVSKEQVAKQQKKLDAEHGKPSSQKRTSATSSSDETSEKKKITQQQIKKKEGVILLPEQLTVKEFAEKAGVQIPKIVKSLMGNGIMATVNQAIDYDTAAIVADELGLVVNKEESVASVEHLLSRNVEELLRDEPENLSPRPPVVVVMGHVDHGKTSILDVVRETDVVSGESGGITQHIGAYQIVHRTSDDNEEHAITFLDTPGHEAFTSMRARGAQVTDIAIIVVAADEGVKPTTIEAINHAKEAGVPIIVALNKIDKENADPEKVKGELAGHGLQPEEWGGDIPVIPCSAKSKKGIDVLLDHVVLVAQLHEFKANSKHSAVATVIESHLDTSHGALATVVVNTGTLRAGDVFLCGESIGKVRAMMDAKGKRQTEVGPSGAVRVSGFNVVPMVGDILQIVPSEHVAKTMLEEVCKAHASEKKRSFADLVSRLSEGKIQQLKIVLKADSQGSLEAIQDALQSKATEEVSVKVIHAAVGGVSKNDVMMAAASEGIVFAFHVDFPTAARQIADREGVKVREYTVIYNLLDDVDALLSGMLEPEEQEKIVGHLEVKEVFLTKKKEQIVGGKVTDGSIKRHPFRLLRAEQEVGTGRIASLRKGDNDIKEAKEGTECGMRVETTVTIEQGDIIEVFVQEFKKKEK